MKYTKEQLQQMAKEVLRAKESCTWDYQQFVMLVAAFTGTSPDYVEKMIESYSKGIGI